MKFTLVRPCPKCPFRKDCQPGWLGRSRAAGIAAAILREDLTFACHETTTHAEDDYGEEEYTPTGEEQHCAGAILLVEKEEAPNQMLQIAERFDLRDPATLDPAAAELVFDSEADFIDHHDDGRRP